ncbi:hypothetical protein TARUN_6324 [Trichoderma arundinaceum]|uniref:NmrA-like domain-containing protein n=1 Tax=Trichoderma arundinaceum TaxID=490622 RepID=A0A395NJ57_TRIAR|nr:hypothetical protein TARUN_6324 [Trichoderma arundinaceum]
MSEIKNVVVIGAGGSLNPIIISSLQLHGFSVSVLVRDTSTVNPPSGTTIYRTDYSRSSLLLAFKDQDAVVNAITMPDFEEQKKIIDVAVEAGVKRFIPAEFGIDTSKEKTVDIVTFLKVKPQIVQYLQSIEDKITWTGIITGPFFDWSLRQGFFSFNLPSRTAYIHQPEYHGHRFSWSNLSTVGEAVAHVLLAKNFPIVANQYVRVRSFNASQDEILESLISATRRAEIARGQEHTDWKVINVDLEDKVTEAQNRLVQGDTSSLGFILTNSMAMAAELDGEKKLSNLLKVRLSHSQSMVRSTKQQSAATLSPLQLRKVRKGTHSCWEFCVSQRYQDDTSDHSRAQTLEQRMMRVESLLDRVLERLETGDKHRDADEPPERATIAEDSIGIDVVNTAAMMSAPASNSAVISVFQNASFRSEIGGEGASSTAASTLTPDISDSIVLGNPGMWPKLTRVSRLLLGMMPSRATLEALDGESSPWICQLLRPLPSLRQSDKFSLLKTMPLESASPSHPTIIARALMIIVICLQQLPRNTDMARLRLPSPRNEYMENLAATIISLATSEDEIIATPEGIECLLLLSIYFVNSGRPRRAWLNNRRALAVAQLMGLHRAPDEGMDEESQRGEASIAGVWPHIIHHDRHLSQILGFPCGVVDTYEPFVPNSFQAMPHPCEDRQDMHYLTQLDRVAALLIEREQRTSTLAFAITQSIDSALGNLANTMPQSWWHPVDRLSGIPAEAMDMLYSKYNVQLWHYQLEMSNHLPFMLDATDRRRCEYSRIACLKAARELIKVYIPLRTTFGMFSCCMTNFQAFTAAVILIFNMFLRTPAAELEVFSGQRDADWGLIADVISVLDAAVERFEDRVALQARDVLKLLQAIEIDPKNLEGDKFHFTIPYFGIITIARKLPAGEPNEVPQMQDGETDGNHLVTLSAAEVSLDYSPSFMTTIDFMGPSTAADVDELMRQWLVEEM